MTVPKESRDGVALHSVAAAERERVPSLGEEIAARNGAEWQMRGLPAMTPEQIFAVRDLLMKRCAVFYDNGRTDGRDLGFHEGAAVQAKHEREMRERAAEAAAWAREFGRPLAAPPKRRPAKRKARGAK